MPDPVTAAVVGGTTLVSGKMQADAAKEAAECKLPVVTVRWLRNRRMYEQGREDARPYRETGYTALKDIESGCRCLPASLVTSNGAVPRPQHGVSAQAWRATTARMLNVGGGAISGNTLRGLEDFGQNLASTEYGNAFNRFQNERTNIYNTLANIAGMGQGAVNTGVTAGQNFAGSQTGLITGQAAAQAAGQVGAANAYSGALGNRIGK
jgi:hypothetical protein